MCCLCGSSVFRIIHFKQQPHSDKIHNRWCNWNYRAKGISDQSPVSGPPSNSGGSARTTKILWRDETEVIMAPCGRRRLPISCQLPTTCQVRSHHEPSTSTNSFRAYCPSEAYSNTNSGQIFSNKEWKSTHRHSYWPLFLDFVDNTLCKDGNIIHWENDCWQLDSLVRRLVLHVYRERPAVRCQAIWETIPPLQSKPPDYHRLSSANER